MKLKHVVAMVAAMSVPAFGASITVTNNNGPAFTQSIVDNVGNAIDGGYAAIGLISSEAALSTLSSGADLAGLFTPFDGAVGAINAVPFAGTYGVQSQGNVLLSAAGSPFANQAIYLVLGDGADLASSSNAAVLKVGTFGAAEPTLATIIVDNTADVILGDYTTFTLNPGPVPNRNNPALALVGIPEPSSSLLIGLAGLALLIRRKR